MGFIFLLLLICSMIAYICYVSDNSVAAIIGFCICLVISVIIMAFVWGQSYCNSVTMQERLISLKQYTHTVEVYSRRAVAEFKHGSSNSPELTDLKYQNYQNQIGEMITDLRDEINEYNTMLVSKSLMGKNWFWNWCIIPAPEGSIILNMSDYIN